MCSKVRRRRDRFWLNQRFGLHQQLFRHIADFANGLDCTEPGVFKKTIEVGAEAITGTDENMKVAFDAAKLNIVPLFAVSKHEAGAPVDSNPNLNSLAERIHLAPGIKKGTDYLFHTRKFMEASQMKVSFPNDTTSISLGGREFGVMDVEMNMMGATLKQKHYATVMKGYALQFVITYTKDEELPTLQTILDSMKFE